MTYGELPIGARFLCEGERCTKVEHDLRYGMLHYSNAVTHVGRFVLIEPEQAVKVLDLQGVCAPRTGRQTKARTNIVVQCHTPSPPARASRAASPPLPPAGDVRPAGNSFKGAGNAIVWRYDPIVLSSITPPRFHVENFDAIATDLEDATDEIVVSFAQMHCKTERNLNAAAREHGFTWQDPDAAVKAEILQILSRVAGAHGMRLTPAACVDARRLSRLAGRSIGAGTHGNRSGCMCARSVDIGAYDTCPHGCVYCYAVQSHQIAKAAYKRHDPDGDFLFPPDGPIIEDGVKPQLDLFET